MDLDALPSLTEHSLQAASASINTQPRLVILDEYQAFDGPATRAGYGAVEQAFGTRTMVMENHEVVHPANPHLPPSRQCCNGYMSAIQEAAMPYTYCRTTVISSQEQKQPSTGSRRSSHWLFFTDHGRQLAVSMNDTLPERPLMIDHMHCNVMGTALSTRGFDVSTRIRLIDACIVPCSDPRELMDPRIAATANNVARKHWLDRFAPPPARKRLFVKPHLSSLSLTHKWQDQEKLRGLWGGAVQVKPCVSVNRQTPGSLCVSAPRNHAGDSRPGVYHLISLSLVLPSSVVTHLGRSAVFPGSSNGKCKPSCFGVTMVYCVAVFFFIPFPPSLPFFPFPRVLEMMTISDTEWDFRLSPINDPFA